MIERPNWDAAVEEAEERWKAKKWEEFGKTSNQEYGFENCDKPISERAEKILDEIAIENDRVDPDGEAIFDHEEVFRVTGRYIRIKRELE